jgi:predicted transcriptional regulator
MVTPMPTLSVKLAEDTKARLDRIAAERGTTPHAFMVGAIEAELGRSEAHDSFLARGLRARDEMLASGKAYDGEEFIAYMRARLRGEKVSRPRLKSIESLTKKRK